MFLIIGGEYIMNKWGRSGKPKNVKKEWTCVELNYCPRCGCKLR